MLSFFHFFGLIKLFSFCSSSLLSLYATWSFCPPFTLSPFPSPLPLRTPFLNAFNSNDEKVSASSTKDNNKYGQAQHMPSGGGGGRRGSAERSVGGGGRRCSLEVQRPFAGGGLPATFSFIFAPASVYFSAARSRLVFSASSSSSS